jgi:hypothetical protein
MPLLHRTIPHARQCAAEHQSRFCADGNVTLIARHTVSIARLSSRTVPRITFRGTVKTDETVATRTSLVLHAIRTVNSKRELRWTWTASLTH